MRPLELISEMCDIINTLSDIVKRQQTEIEAVESRGAGQERTQRHGLRGREKDGCE